MKKTTKLLALSMTAGLLLAGCDNEDNLDTEFPGVEEPADPVLEEDIEEDEE